MTIRQETYSILRNLPRQNGFKEEGESESRTIFDNKKAHKIKTTFNISVWQLSWIKPTKREKNAY